MELYYRGGQFKDNPIRCYDANFEDLGDQFDHTFRNGVLTVQADFAEQISGLTIEDKDHDTVYHLRYLDSPQFAWLADTFWLDYGMMTLGDEARYYSDAERQEQAERERTEHEQTRNVLLCSRERGSPRMACKNMCFPQTQTGASCARRSCGAAGRSKCGAAGSCASSPRFRRRISAANTVRMWQSTCRKSC